MKKIDIVVVQSEDWDAIYVNGKLDRADHLIHACDICNAIKLPAILQTFEFKRVDEKWLDREGQYPELLTDVEME